MSFEKNKYQIVRNALSLDLIEFINTSCEIHENVRHFFVPATESVPYPYGDPQVPNSFSSYSTIYSEAALRFLKPTIEKITDAELHESYSYSRNYYHGATLKKHFDRPECEYSATLCISKEKDWPIFIEGVDGVVVEVELNPSDMIVYRGDILNHWRDFYHGTTHRQMFLHYVNASGKYKDRKFDGRPMLALQKK